MPPEPPEFLDPVDIPLEILGAIGGVASQWALLEHYIDRTIWVLAGLDWEKGACLTAQLAHIGRRLDAVISLVRLLDIKDDKKNKLAAALNSFAEATNQLAKKATG